MLEFTEWLKSEGKAVNSIKRYTRVVSQFEAWYQIMNPGGSLLDATSLDMQDYKKFLIEEATYLKGKKKNPTKYSISTINNIIKSLKVFYRYLLETNQLDHEPTNKLKTMKIQNQRNVKWLDRNKRKRLLNYIDLQKKQKNLWKHTRNKLVLYLMLHAGFRVSEVVQASVQDVHFDLGIIEVRNGKGTKSRKVPINQDLKIALMEWLDIREDIKGKNQLIHSERKEKRFTISGVEHLVKVINENTGLTELTPHTLRHTFGHDLISLGISIEKVAELLGHDSIETTRIYVAPGEQELKAAVEMLSSH